MRRAHKIRLVPNKTQLELLYKAAGTSRYVYNWAVAKWEELYKEHKNKGTEKPTAYMLSRLWTEVKPEWASETARYAQTEAILAVGQAYINFWRHSSGKPSFKKKGECDSFKVSCEKIKIADSRVYIPALGWIKMREELRFEGKLFAATVSRSGKLWHVSLQVDMPTVSTDPVVADTIVGVDVGIASIATASDGSRLDNPKHLKNKTLYLKRMQRKLARQVKGSKRRQRTKDQISKAHLKISNQRNDSIHKFTSRLAKNHGTAVIETLDVEEMKEQGKTWLNRLLQDTAMKEVHRQLEYKMVVVKAPKYFRSSKTCSSCGAVKQEFPCSIRTYKCGCGLSLDRDLNAAYNLRDMSWVTGHPAKAGTRREPPKEAANCATEIEAYFSL